MTYTRTNIYLTPLQKQGVKDLAIKQGVKPAELIRRIVDAYLRKEASHASR